MDRRAQHWAELSVYPSAQRLAPPYAPPIRYLHSEWFYYPSTKRGEAVLNWFYSILWAPLSFLSPCFNVCFQHCLSGCRVAETLVSSVANCTRHHILSVLFFPPVAPKCSPQTADSSSCQPRAAIPTHRPSALLLFVLKLPTKCTFFPIFSPFSTAISFIFPGLNLKFVLWFQKKSFVGLRLLWWGHQSGTSEHREEHIPRARVCTSCF